MRPSILLTLILSSTASAESIRWVFDNVAMFQHFAAMTKHCYPMMEDLIQNNAATLVIPHNDAVDKFTSSPEYDDMTKEEICDLVKYHLIRGSYNTEEITEAGPFLRTMLKQPGSNDFQLLQVEKETVEDRGRGINFYSGLQRKSSIFYGDYDGLDNLDHRTYIHFIDRVLTPPLPMADTALAAGLTSAIGAANKIGLDWWSDNDATYFMPTNEAFRKVGSVFNDMSDDELRDVLTYHYLNNTETPIYTSKMTNANWTTAGGEKVLLSHSDEKDFLVNTAKILQSNILVQNGVMYLIDQVGNPNNIESRLQRYSPFSLPAFSNATASDKPPFTGMVPHGSKYHLEPGQIQKNIPMTL